MQLTQEQKDLIIKKLQTITSQSSICSICGSKEWNVADAIFELREFNKGQLVIGGGRILPILPLTCVKCGNTLFLNAMFLEVIKPEQEKKGGEQK